MFVRANEGFTYDSFVPVDGRIVTNVSAQVTRIVENIADYNVSWSEDNLDDYTYENKEENTFSPRLFLRGNEIYVGFEYTPNYAKTSQENMPNNFHNNRYLKQADGSYKWMGPQNITGVLKGSQTTVDARFFTTPAGSSDTGLVSDLSNPNLLFITWGTLDRVDDTPESGRTEAGIYFKRSTDKGETWGPTLKLADKEDVVIHEKEVSSFATADGSSFYNVWLQEEDVFDQTDPDSGLDSWVGRVDYNVSVAAE
jgi:hypothetical protein